MIVHFSKTFKVTAAGQRLEAVTCEKCGTVYYYRLVRVGTGRGRAPYFLGQTAAAERARINAQKDLAQRLKGEAELVPCPQCQWVNRDLLKRYARRKYRCLDWKASGIALVGTIAATNVWMMRRQQNTTLTTLIILGLGLLCAGGMLVFRYWVRQWLDPNRNFLDHPVLPPGTPLALLSRHDEQTGRATLEPVLRPCHELTGFREWAILSPGHMAFPEICCVCLGDAATFYRAPLNGEGIRNLDVPLCWPCSTQVNQSWRTIVLLSIACVTGLAALASALFPGIDSHGRWLIFVVTAFILGLVACWSQVPQRAVRPFRLDIVDADRSIMRFSATNPEYTELLTRHIRESGASAE